MITNDNYKQIHAWAKILGKIVENITPKTAKECAGFCYIVISFNISRIQSDREKASTLKAISNRSRSMPCFV